MIKTESETYETTFRGFALAFGFTVENCGWSG